MKDDAFEKVKGIF